MILQFRSLVDAFRKAGSHRLYRCITSRPRRKVTTRSYGPGFLLEKGQQGNKTGIPPDDSRVEPYFTGSFLRSTRIWRKEWKSIYFQHILDEPMGSEPAYYYARIADLVHRNLPGVRTMDAVDASDIPEELRRTAMCGCPARALDNQDGTHP